MTVPSPAMAAGPAAAQLATSGRPCPAMDGRLPWRDDVRSPRSRARFAGRREPMSERPGGGERVNVSDGAEPALAPLVLAHGVEQVVAPEVREQHVAEQQLAVR